MDNVLCQKPVLESSALDDVSWAIQRSLRGEGAYFQGLKRGEHESRNFAHIQEISRGMCKCIYGVCMEEVANHKFLNLKELHQLLHNEQENTTHQLLTETDMNPP